MLKDFRLLLICVSMTQKNSACSSNYFKDLFEEIIERKRSRNLMIFLKKIKNAGLNLKMSD
jgi:hypothetical protein